MKRIMILMCAAGLMISLGAGCQKKAATPIVKEQIVGQYEQAQTGSGREASYEFQGLGRRAILTIPSDWTGDGPVWKKEKDSKDQIRVSAFAEDVAEGEWTKQQGEDVHQVMGFSQKSDRYLLIVHQLGLKAILVKMFVPFADARSGYLFGECRISDDHKDDASLWNACKTALESLR